MTGSAANVRVWENADLYVAPLGTTLPDDIATPLDVAFVPVGIITEAAITDSKSTTVTPIQGYGVGTVRITRSKDSFSFGAGLLENNDISWKLANAGGASSAASGVTTRRYKRSKSNQFAFVLVLVDEDITTRRVIARGDSDRDGDISIEDSDATAPKILVQSLADSSGEFFYDVTDDPAAVPAA